MSIASVAWAILLFFWSLVKIWAFTFYVSFANLSTMWIIVPIWLSWFFAEIFQEKQGTSFGNAISNGVIPLWVGIDWIRQLTDQIIAGQIGFGVLIVSKYFISAVVLAYGLMIIVLGIKGNPLVRYLGRIREVTYILVIFTPFIYGLIQPNYKYFMAIILFFPVFYYIIEIIDEFAPEPKIYKEEG
jgi:hypothetical protein